MADQQQYQLAKIVGDGKSEVVVGRDMAAKDFGQGGGVFVSVKLTCDQGDEMVEYAIRVAGQIAQKHLIEQFAEHQKLLYHYGLVK